MSAEENTERPVEPVVIAGRRVGPREPAFVVAEAGVNHNGCERTALAMVDAAANCGADAVKFQMFRSTELTTPSASTTEYQRSACGEVSQRTMLSRLELSQEAFARIARRCVDQTIALIVTPFGEVQVDRAVELEVSAIKIASTDLRNPRLVERAAAAGLPIIMSTGASTSDEIEAAVKQLHRADAMGRLVLLHCVSCYPTPIEAINLRAIAALERAYHVPCGLSDHTTSTRVGAWAVSAGASLVEKHFTLDRHMPGPDQALSLKPDQLTEYVSEIRSSCLALGDGVVGMSPLEEEVRAVAGKSVVAAVDIPKGRQLESKMLAVKRPGLGIAPAQLDRLVGRDAAVDIPSDTVLSWDMVR